MPALAQRTQISHQPFSALQIRMNSNPIPERSLLIISLLLCLFFYFITFALHWNLSGLSWTRCDDEIDLRWTLLSLPFFDYAQYTLIPFWHQTSGNEERRWHVVLLIACRLDEILPRDRLFDNLWEPLQTSKDPTNQRHSISQNISMWFTGYTTCYCTTKNILGREWEGRRKCSQGGIFLVFFNLCLIFALLLSSWRSVLCNTKYNVFNSYSCFSRTISLKTIPISPHFILTFPSPTTSTLHNVLVPHQKLNSNVGSLYSI